MTCICGMIRDGHVYMAGDLMGSNGFTGRVYPDSKVFVNGEFIIGYTSSFRMGQILEWNWEQPLRQEGITDREYMQLNVVESLRNTFAIFGYGVKEGLEDIGGNFLIGYRGCLYEMQDNFSLLKIDDYAAVGSGQYHAEAILSLLHQDEELHPFQIMETAIGTAAHFTQSVSYECTVYSSNPDAEQEWDDIINQETPKVNREMLESMSKDEIISMLFGEEESSTLEESPSEAVIEIPEKFNMFEYNENLNEFFAETEFVKLTVDIRYADKFIGDEDLKTWADIFNIKYPHNISDKKLCEKLNNFLLEAQQWLIEQGDK